ncbi:NAD(P)H-binding protein [Amycolatopsis rhabdoformis]|uniref:NAD(P)H-binding protein n=1 Tax=Amycolatopsis rhabdoformis TaxID=1448059 RepID=A0ABZ1IGV8_9PSEU|nr:NAD(P)H-binding protein [Amycolatopsis rhabdoformis]WSE33354.1 NAD(P)H-binding protein [Amycolatopsis rhabdoformis]
MIVVTGATGNVGRPLVAALAAAGAEVTAVSRTPPAELPGGVRHRVADLAAPESLREVVAGAEALFLFPGGPAPAELADVVKAGGVRRVVLLSSQGAATRPGDYAFFAAYEQAVRAAVPAATVLRPSGFTTNTLAWAPSVRASRQVEAPFGDVALPFVDPADIAAMAAAILLDSARTNARPSAHDGVDYEVTGPEALTPRDRAAAIGAALGEPVRFVEQTPAQARAQLVAVMPPPIADATLGVLGSPLPAERRVSADVHRVLGRPARSYAEWLADFLPAFR